MNREEGEEEEEEKEGERGRRGPTNFSHPVWTQLGLAFHRASLDARFSSRALRCGPPPNSTAIEGEKNRNCDSVSLFPLCATPFPPSSRLLARSRFIRRAN
ncbi:hypothetical protein ALC57_14771 [Trachymyrmex cornetzi]|uniref:Uncharacterized protein n=1 Tax=Trachymyrmex cornetzi TaxID=471704 RepID=A0A195DJM8_9HYME|nr:hypothetical protein ALC57_14771 [Trachymyrmex cornetzi]